MFNYRKNLGLIALVCSIAGLGGCGGGGSGTDNDKPVLVSCQDPLVVQDDGTCGEPRPPYVPPPCPEGQIRVGAVCETPDKPLPVRMPAENEVVIFVNVDLPVADKLAAISGYNLHLWQDCGNGWGNSVTDRNNATYSIPTTWPAGPGVRSLDDSPTPSLMHDPYYGAYFVIPTSATGTCGNFIVKTPNGAEQTGNLDIDIKRDGGIYDRMAWVIVNSSDMRNSRFSTAPICINDICSLEKSLLGISDIEAHWLDADTILWDRKYQKVELYRSTAGGMVPTEAGSLEGGTMVSLLSAGRTMTAEEQAAAPHLASYFAYDLPIAAGVNAVENAKALLKDELLIVGRFDSVEKDQNGNEVTIERGLGTRIQIPLALDALYGEAAKDETLGVRYNGDNVQVSLWAPNAQSVDLRIYTGEPLRIAENLVMQFNAETGIWSYSGAKSQLDRKHYRFRVQTYNPYAKKVHRLEVTDPYSTALSANSRYSLFVNFDDADVKPDGWDGHLIPTVVSPEAMSIYEVHVRDFSISDQSTSPLYRGKFMAFTQQDSAPVQHLKSLADTGLTHVHFLPLNDFTGVDEVSSAQINLDSYVFQLCQAVPDETEVFICSGEEKQSNSATLREVLASFGTDTDKARRLIAVFAEMDGFNWGYNPYHFNTPDGSYASNANGITRIKEMRAMNKALHEMGLRVIMDVVYPHTFSSSERYVDSVFDKIVPGYYYRSNPATGEVENGTDAGSDTATERTMMAKFVQDSLVHWAAQYKVDGFRFDQSGFMPKSVLVDSLAAVQEVDEDTYFYAEAWSPAGGTSATRIGEDNLATQVPLAGTGIGTFNDRMRNSLQQLRLFNDGSFEDQDRIRAGLAGNLRDFVLVPKSGYETTAESVDAYNLDPQEAINYVEKHDNETLWDWIHRPDALPADTDLAERVRIHNMTLSIPVLSQGVPFIQMGSDLLRSKSMSPNSYNAGDWFNNVDFTKQSNNWAVGLPPELRDGVTDEYVSALFADPEAKPAAANIEQASSVFKEFLMISDSSPLFSLQTAQEVMDRVGFHDGGVTQTKGLIVMSIDDGAGTVTGTDTARADLDPELDAIVVVFNGTGTAKNVTVNTATGFELHLIQQGSADEAVSTASFVEGDEGSGSFSVPAYTTAVFVKPQGNAQGVGLSATATTDTLEPPSNVAAPYGETDVYVRGGVSAAGWDATDANKMSYDGSGVYSVILNVPAGSHIFKVAAADWSTPNLGSAETMEPGDTIGLVQGLDTNVTINIAEAGLYRFILNALESTTAPTLSVVNPDTFQGVPVYLRGTVSAAGWDANSTNQVAYEGDSIYALTLDMVPGNYSFKIASNDWSTVNLGTSTAVTLGEALPLVQGSPDNIPISITEAGRYRFEINTRNPDAPIVRVYVDDLFAATPAYARGTVSSAGWDATDVNKFTYQGSGLYTLELNILAGSYVFKVAETGWSNPNLGAPSATLGVPTTLIQGSSDNIAITIPADGDYLFTLDTTKAEAVTVTVDEAGN